MHRIRTWARQKAHGPAPLAADGRRTAVPRTRSDNLSHVPSGSGGGVVGAAPAAGGDGVAAAAGLARPGSGNAVPLPPAEGEKTAAAAAAGTIQPSVGKRFVLTVRDILLSSYINVLLVFVPVGIAAHFAKLSAGIVFAMNAIAIIPLAGLLSHATESVASRLGDTIGALMNVTFGNAVELIIFIALVKNEIEIVQASLVGSILANLLLILGMSFFLGGLRYREQIYNSTVTQMSACLLSLSVSSLLLPTAFHASFSSAHDADAKVLKVSRGTSVVLLLVYLLYLVFQLNSHAYMYESTPQEVIERESHPGPAAGYFNSSSSSSDSSSDSSSSSSDSDSDSDSSRGTAKRIKRAIKRGRNKIQNRNASSGDSTETPASPTTPEARSPTAASGSHGGLAGAADHGAAADPGAAADDEADAADAADAQQPKPRHKKKHRRHHHRKGKINIAETAPDEAKADEGQHDANAARAAAGLAAVPSPPSAAGGGSDEGRVRRVDFAVGPDVEAQTAPRPKPFSLRALASPAALSKTLSVNVFTAPHAVDGDAGGSSDAYPLHATAAAHGEPAQDAASAAAAAVSAAPSRPQPQIRRTASLPVVRSYRYQPSALPPIVPIVVNRVPKTIVMVDGEEEGAAEHEPAISRTTAILLLLVSTGLVALCAEFMVGSINEVVSGNSGISEAFIGLILLPIVGNAAEHVTGVTVAMKNKMDLALGVALGSSIQIAIFVTPVVVLLGWIMDKDMSLYFTLFETVSMFVSAFIVNFLVLDGRSNYLEGALLCAAYVIIAVAAFFYPGSDAANELGGGASNETVEAVTETAKLVLRGLVNLKARS